MNLIYIALFYPGTQSALHSESDGGEGVMTTHPLPTCSQLANLLTNWVMHGSLYAAVYAHHTLATQWRGGGGKNCPIRDWGMIKWPWWRKSQAGTLARIRGWNPTSREAVGQ